MCSGLCTSRRFHDVDDDQGCRPGCREQRECLRHHDQCPRLAAIRTHVLQYVTSSSRIQLALDFSMPFLGRQPSSSQDPWEWRGLHGGAHSPDGSAHTSVCPRVTKRVFDNAWVVFCFGTSDFLPSSLIIVTFSIFVQRHTLVGNEFRGCAMFTDGGTHTKRQRERTQAGSAVARSPLGACHVTLGPVILLRKHVWLFGRSKPAHQQHCRALRDC